MFKRYDQFHAQTKFTLDLSLAERLTSSNLSSWNAREVLLLIITHAATTLSHVPQSRVFGACVLVLRENGVKKMSVCMGTSQ